MHSSAIARGQKGFLFLGNSEAGKTTVARLSVGLGYPALGDDINFVLRDGKSGYHLVAAPSPVLSPVGYSSLRPSLRGIFSLVQDERDHLVPMSSKQIAQVLFDQFLHKTPYTKKLPDQAIELAFRTCCTIARTVPGYELHFRKSPDFWKVIDAEFGL